MLFSVSVIAIAAVLVESASLVAVMATDVWAYNRGSRSSYAEVHH